MISKNLTNILGLTLITLLVWVGFQVFQIFTTSSIPPATQKQLQPLNPNLDTALLEELNDPEKTLK
ncbi:MAG: hypothetical protein Q8P13_00185 [bacterium]|nr:hypothetical protein [bacterium]